MTQDLPDVLLVEDDPLIALNLEDELQNAGFSVVTHTNPVSAMTEIERNESVFRALVTDIDLGGAPNGWELAHRGRERFPRMVLIYMSGQSAANWMANGLPDSVMLQKPFAVAQLLMALATKLNEHPPMAEPH